MRRITTTSTVGKVHIPAPLSKEFALLALLIAAVAWVGYAFLQEVLLNHRLNAQAAELRQRNTTIAAQNDGYRRDLMASTAGTAADEDARQHGYARPDERVYVVGRPAAQAPLPMSAGTSAPGKSPAKSPDKSPAMKHHPVKAPGQSGKGVTGWQAVGRWISNLWHR